MFMKVIKNKKYAYFSFATLFVGTLAFLFPPHFSATNAQEYTGTTTASGEWTWQVNVEEVLNMTVTYPQAEGWAKGDVGQFLRNKVNVSVSSNNGQGFTAGMTTKKDTTELTNVAASTATLPTIDKAQAYTCTGTEDTNCLAFSSNHWGYSLDDTEEGKAGTYKPLVGAKEVPITVLNSATQTSMNKDVFFGAKADKGLASGTYKGTVVFTVTTGTQGSDLPAAAAGEPAAAGPEMSPNVSPSQAGTYTYTTNNRTYRSTADSVAVATKDGQKKSAATDFVSPLGVNEKADQTFTNIQYGSIVTTTLMVVAILAAAVGIFFFVLARRRDREEEEIQEV